MHFIESVFGLSPDNGSGATEAGIFLALAVVVIAAWYLFSRRKRRAG